MTDQGDQTRESTSRTRHESNSCKSERAQLIGGSSLPMFQVATPGALRKVYYHLMPLNVTTARHTERRSSKHLAKGRSEPVKANLSFVIEDKSDTRDTTRVRFLHRRSRRPLGCSAAAAAVAAEAPSDTATQKHRRPAKEQK